MIVRHLPFELHLNEHTIQRKGLSMTTFSDKCHVNTYPTSDKFDKAVLAGKV
jgi:hypothetical protein